MSTWELINPSDKITFKADSHELACLAVGLLGGKYGATELDKEGEGEPRTVPLWLFGGADEYFQKHFGRDVAGSFTACDKRALAEVYDSFLIGSMSERWAFEKAMSVILDEDKAAFKEQWQDRERSSMNDICAYAYNLARGLRNKAAEESNAEQG